MPVGFIRGQAEAGGIELPGQSVVAGRTGCDEPLWRSAKAGAASATVVVGVESTATGIAD
ncbi:hypothetical protein D3C84_804860 [compost metagenome]